MIAKLSGTVLLKGGKIYDPYADKTQRASILIQNGFIKKIGQVKSLKSAKIIDCSGKMITPGFIDLHAHFREPGREDKETLETGAVAAMAGGFTRVCIMPNTEPPLDNPESIRFIIEKSADLPITIHPIGTITLGQKGKELAEIGEMVAAGAVAVSDDGLPVQNGQVFRYALEYAQKYNIPVINHAEDIPLRNEGVMNESAFSTRLGLPGNPDISESVMVFRDLELAEYTGGSIHIPHVSTKRSVDLIRRYKSKGIKVTAEVTPHHLGLTQEVLHEYDTHAKVAPPLRTRADNQALIEGLLDGTIDCIATDHAPHTIEEKEMDFFHAPCGMIGLESAFALSHTVLKQAGASTEQVIQWFTKNPAQIMGFSLHGIEENHPANLNIIDPDEEWEFKTEHIHSRSKNSPMLGMTFKGRIQQTIYGKHSFIKR